MTHRLSFRFALRLSLVLACAAGVGALSAAASELDLASAINEAGRQRMLTQRISKSYVQIGLGAKIEESQSQLQQAVALFEKQHARLRTFAPSAAVGDALTRVEVLWRPFKQAAMGPVDMETARRLANLDADLIAACEQLVSLLQKRSPRPYSRLVNTAGRQRMLSQRLAKSYMYKAAGLATASMKDELERAKNEFEGALAALRRAPENTRAINEQLDQVAQQWVWLESSLAMHTTVYYPLIVADASEKILQRMETITEQYVALAAAP